MLATAPLLESVSGLVPAAATAPHPAALRLAEDALALLSLEEKVGLVAGNGTMTLAAQPKIGLHDEFWFSDGPHTVRPELDRQNFNSAHRTDDHSTVLPTLSALAATWDTDLALRFGQLLGREARDRGKDMLLGPGVNLHRTPLNGRNYEYFGEDPHLTARLAVSYIQGVQSQDVAACIKHFVGNDQELARGSVDVLMDERTLRELYLVPFEAAIVEAGVLGVMNGYNRFRGEFCSHNSYLNNQVLKREWGFPGFVVSDWGGLHETVAGALGGLDVEMHAGEVIRHYRAPLIEAVREGRVPASVVDEMARRVLYVMARIGKLHRAPRAPGQRNTPAHQTFAREVAEQAIVLLKNDLGVLPLAAPGLRHLLVIGANADTKHVGGGWSAEGKPPYEATPLTALRAYLPAATRITYLPGPFAEIFSPLPESVIETIDTSDLERGAAQKGWRVEYFTAPDTTPAATGFDRVLAADFSAKSAPVSDLRLVRWSVVITAPESGTYRFSLNNSGLVRLLINDTEILAAAATGAAELIAGTRYSFVVEFTPSSAPATCVFGWRLPSRQPVLPEALAAFATEADAVLFFTGNRLGHGRAQECEGADRPDLSLPEGDDDAIAAVLAAAPETVVINQSGSPVSMPWIQHAATLVQYWFCGMDGGTALTRILFGEVNPSGRLPFSFPRQLTDTPAHALGEYGPVTVNYREGVFIGYRWHDARAIEPLFPFGHGLSYTTFAIGTPEPDSAELPAGDSLRLRVSITNTGSIQGAEVIQLYVGNPPTASVPRPVRELRDFAKVHLTPGETRTVVFTLGPRAFAFWDTSASGWRAEPGLYTLQAGSSSRCLSAPAAVRLI